MRIALLGCSILKQPFPGPAYLVYSRSPRFSNLYTHAVGNGLTPYIISGKYGLITHTKIIYPYNQKLTKNSSIINKCKSQLNKMRKGNTFISYLFGVYQLVLPNNLEFDRCCNGKDMFQVACIMKNKTKIFPYEKVITKIIEYVYRNKRVKIVDIIRLMKNNHYAKSTIKAQIQRLCHCPFLIVKNNEVLFRLQNDKWIFEKERKRLF